MFSKRKGFTLVELLIVIIVIGILAGAMMLASGSASESAKASNVISELRNAKAASMLFLTDHLGSTDGELAAVWNNATMRPTISPYMDNPGKANGLYFATYLDNNTNVFLVGRSEDARVIAKAISQQPTLLFDAAGVAPAANATEVYMRVR